MGRGIKEVENQGRERKKTWKKIKWKQSVVNKEGKISEREEKGIGKKEESTCITDWYKFPMMNVITINN